MSLKARIYQGRPDWWLLIHDGHKVYHHRRYWTWDGAREAAVKLVGAAPIDTHPICDGECCP